MAFDLDWGTYADWLMRVEGLDMTAALAKVSTRYQKQYGKSFEQEQSEQLREFIEERF